MLSQVDPRVELAPWSYGVAVEGVGDDFYPYDPERARALLDEARFVDGFEIEALTSGVSNAERQALEMIGSMWSTIGVTVQVVEVDDVARLRALLNQHAMDQDVGPDAWLYSAGFQPTDPPLQAFSCLPAVRSWEQYCEPAIDALSDVSFDLGLAERERYLQDLDHRLAEASVRIPLVTTPRLYLVSGTVVSALSPEEAGQDAREVVATSRGTQVQFFGGSVPHPSRHIKLERRQVLGEEAHDEPDRSVSVGEVNTNLSRALRGAGHELMYLPLVPNEGFVITTIPEWIDDNGVSLREQRFAPNPPTSCGSGSLSWWRRLLACVVEGTHQPSGTPRIYVLRVSPEPWSRERAEVTVFASRQDLLLWTSEGASDRVPEPLLAPPFDTHYEVDVFVYELEVVDEEWSLLESSRHEGHVHREGTCRFDLEDDDEVAYCFLPLLLSGQ